jgi:hypothetical protein
MLGQPKLKATPTPTPTRPKIKPPKIEQPKNILDQNRAAARAAGEAKYIRECPCKACGGVEFYTRNATCLECERTRTQKRKAALLTEPPRPVQLRKPVVVPQTPGKYMHTRQIKEQRWATR